MHEEQNRRGDDFLENKITMPTAATVSAETSVP
jgi:hypothetical protein